VSEAGQVKRGDSAAFLRDASDDHWQGGPAVVLTVTRQPGADTRLVTDEVMRAVDELRDALPQGTQVRAVYSQKSFIDRAIANVLEALRDGVVLVVIVLFLFLMNFRTTLITLTAIPLSLVMTSLVFAALGMSINTMTLGGLAVAIGELVDDAIVDVENIFRRLRLNRQAGHPLHPLLVIYRASVEVRSSIVYSTMIVVLVFVPLFALDGIEGRLFVPLGLAYIVSILASLLVSLTVTPALSWWLLGQPREGSHDDDGWLLRRLKQVTGPVIRFSLRFPWLNLAAVAAMVVLAAGALLQLDRDFLPSFNEGTVQLNVVLPPGTSLQTSQQINRQVERALGEVPDVVQLVRRTGRAELDEHAEGVNTSEYLLELNPQSKRTREEQLESIREVLAEVPGIVTSVEQPISHLISHMLSGIRAQVGIRIFGDDLEQLRREGERMEAAISQ
ncbi:MAG: efflux RND transporter permease subunit, partial [Planctomycetaceae bacterium]